MAKLPKTIFVKHEADDDDGYLVVSDNRYELAEMGQKISIGTYQLVETEAVEVVLKTMKRRA